ncbi:MAG: hypothetical protein QXU99_00480 [Candidatus Bathyarchaeia archaeon]
MSSINLFVNEMFFARWNKTWVFITLCALMTYNLYWLCGVSVNVYRILATGKDIQVTWWRFWIDYVLTGLIGNVIRSIGTGIALISLYLIWIKTKSYSNVKRQLGAAVFCEGAFFLTLLPITLITFVNGVASVLMIAYLLQIMLVSPALITLSLKIWSYSEKAKDHTLKLATNAGLCYLIGIWINGVLRWVNSAANRRIEWVISEMELLGFFNSIVMLTLSLIFAIFGTHVLLHRANKEKDVKLFAIALLTLSLHFAIFVLYSAVTNNLNSVLLVEIWPVALVGLGAGLLKKIPRGKL